LGGEDGDFMSVSGQVSTQASEISFGAAKRGRIALHKMCDSHDYQILPAVCASIFEAAMAEPSAH
jgi:hypothetical protein